MGQICWITLHVGGLVLNNPQHTGFRISGCEFGLHLHWLKVNITNYMSMVIQDMNRRNFNRGLILAVIPVDGLLWPGSAKAALDPATMAATAQLASGVLSFMSRGSDPTAELIISITKMLEAIGKKLDAIDQKLDILSDQIADVRALVTQTPKATIQQLLLINIREPWNAFVQAYGQKALFNSQASYLERLHVIYARQQEARTKFLDFSQSSKYDGLVDAVLAYDAESSMVVEMLQVAATNDLVRQVEPALLRAALLDYIEYFDAATTPTTTGGPAFLLAELKRKYEDAMKEPIEVRPSRLISAWEERPPVSIPFSRVIEEKMLPAECGSTGDLCLVPGRGKRGCVEPGLRHYFEVKIRITADTIAEQSLLPLDDLKRPFVYRLSSDNMCEDGQIAESITKTKIASIQPRVDKINQFTIAYYNLMHVVQVGIFARDSARTALKEFDAIYRA